MENYPLALVTVFYVLLGVAWVLVLGFSLVDLVRGLARGERRWVLGMVALFVGALALRLLLATWGPGDDQFRHQHFYSEGSGGGFIPYVDWHLGTAPHVLFQLVFTVLPASDVTIIWISLLFGALTPIVLALFLREVGSSRLTAVAAGARLAIQPLAVRFSGDMCRVSHVVFLAVMALWAFARHRRLGGVRSLLVFVSAAWLCARSRPEAGLVLPLAGLVLLIIQLDRKSLRQRWPYTAAAGLVVAGLLGVGALVVSAQYEPALLRHLTTIREGRTHMGLFSFTWFDASYTSPVAWGLTALGVGWAVWRRDRVAIWAIASFGVLFAVAPNGISKGLAIAYARYQGLMLVPLCTLAAYGVLALDTAAGAAVRRLGGSPRWGRLFVVVATAAVFVATSIVPLRDVCAPRTIDLEYRFVQDSVTHLPSDALVYGPVDSRENHVGGFRDADRVFLFAGGTEWQTWPLPDTPGDRPAYFYRAPACYANPALFESNHPGALVILERCRDGVARSRREGAWTTVVPALFFSHEEWTEPELEIGFYPLTFP